MRHVYRQEFRQPLLVALFLFQVGSGVYLATHSDVRPIDRFRTFQITAASGLVKDAWDTRLMIFVLSHLAAGARADAVTWRGPALC